MKSLYDVLFVDGNYSDFDVKIHGKVYKLHSKIVCQHSTFLDTMYKNKDNMDITDNIEIPYIIYTGDEINIMIKESLSLVYNLNNAESILQRYSFLELINIYSISEFFGFSYIDIIVKQIRVRYNLIRHMHLFVVKVHVFKHNNILYEPQTVEDYRKLMCTILEPGLKSPLYNSIRKCIEIIDRSSNNDFISENELFNFLNMELGRVWCNDDSMYYQIGDQPINVIKSRDIKFEETMMLEVSQLPILKKLIHNPLFEDTDFGEFIFSILNIKDKETIFNLISLNPYMKDTLLKKLFFIDL